MCGNVEGMFPRNQIRVITRLAPRGMADATPRAGGRIDRYVRDRGPHSSPSGRAPLDG